MASDGSLTFSTGVDNSGLEQGLEDAKKKVESLQSDLDNAKARKSAIEVQMEDAKKAIEEAKAALADLNSKEIKQPDKPILIGSELLEKEWTLPKNEYQALLAEQEELKRSWAEYNDAVAERSEAEQRIASQENALNQLQKEWNEADSEVQSYERSVERANELLGVYEQQVNEAIERNRQLAEMAGQQVEQPLSAETMPTPKLSDEQINSVVSDYMARLTTLFESVASAQNPIRALESELGNLEDEILANEQATQVLVDRFQQLSAIDPSNEAEFESAKLEAQGLANEIELARIKNESLRNTATEVKMQLSFAKIEANSLGARLSNVAEKGMTAVRDAAGSIVQRLDQMRRRALGFLISMVGVAALASHMKKFAQSVWQAAQENEYLRATVNGVKAAYAGLANGIAAAIIPVLHGIVRIATSMLLTLARLIDTVFKTNLVGAIQSAAASYGAATGGAGKQAKATDKLAKSLKEATRQLMAFDELNVLNAEHEDDSAGALDDLGEDAGGGGGVDPAIIEGIDAGLAKIMLLAGAALIALGLILTFTGHIAIGVSLIAIGALMMYTAYSEQWDKLPEQVQEKLLMLLQFVAGALIVIGVILLLFGQIPLGIGFIIAGVTIFAITEVMGEGSIEGLVQAFYENILGIVAGALIVLGIILCVTGVGLGVGVALIAVGALLFVGEAVLNWDTMSEEMREFFSTAMRIIGGVLVVLGIMLCITGMIPLGIAAIVVGITVLVAQAALNEEDMPKKIEEFFANAIPVIAGALVVIGVLLLLTGVGIALGIAAIVAGIAILSVAEEKLDEEYIPQEVENFMNGLLQFIKDNAEFLLVLGIILLFNPLTIGLGIACIIAGIAGMVMPEDYDFNALKDQISEVWDSVVQWWHDNVEHIFTLEFWEGVFQSIADGLWNALSGAGEVVTGFFSDIGRGASELAANLGFNFEIGIPQIDLPFLASGAVIPPNRSFMAVLGDQTNGRNLEAPEGLIRQIVREESGVGNNNEILTAMYDLLAAVQEGKTLYVDGQVLGQTARRELATMERMGGY